MPISNKPLQKRIEDDLDWRLAELAILREIIILNNGNSIRSRVLFRSAWAMLYAHYEGFCKTALELYSEFLSQLPECNSIPHCTFLYLHHEALKSAKQLPVSAAYEFYTVEVANLKLSPPPLVSIDTKSNLWPNVLEELLIAFDIDPTTVLDERLKVKTLVARRNDIAHGQKVFIKDVNYYLEYEAAIQNCMYALALAIVERSSGF